MIDNRELLDKLVEFREFFAEHGGAKFVRYNYITQQYCAIGALQHILTEQTGDNNLIFNKKVYNYIHQIINDKCKEEYSEYIYRHGISYINDRHGQDAALAIIDKVVSELEEKVVVI